MSDSEENQENKHVTKATTSEPQEEFIEPKARPSEPETAVPEKRKET